MFRLPKCPHCGTIYRYKDVKEAIRKKDNTCYHCGKRFRARLFPGILAGAALPIILAILINILLMTRMKNLELIPMFIVTVLFILLIFLIAPFFTRFEKTEENSDIIEKQK